MNSAVTVYPYASLGHINHGWLDAHYHFSFSNYYNPSRMGFGSLLVINDDTIMAGKGFPTHAHDNMEIITYVRHGAITHTDSMGNVGKTKAGDVQVMSAGTGVRHSEYNLENEDTRLYQIWIKPNTENAVPRWEAREFPKEFINNQLNVLVSGRTEHSKENCSFIYADAVIYGGKLQAGKTIVHAIKHQAYILASVGSFSINDNIMQQGDGAEVIDKTLDIIAHTDCELLIIDTPA